MFGLSTGQFVAGLVCILLGVVTYLVFKMAYVALKLLTEIADDTPLQLMELAGDEYDQRQVAQDEDLVISVAPDDPAQVAEIYNSAAKVYKKYGRKVCSFDDSTFISIDEVVLCDSDGKTSMTMVLYEGEWIRE